MFMCSLKKGKFKNFAILNPFKEEMEIKKKSNKLITKKIHYKNEQWPHGCIQSLLLESIHCWKVL